MSSVRRREFLMRATGAGVASGGWLVGATRGRLLAAGRSDVPGANETVRVAVVGVRGRGKALAGGFAKAEGAQVVALCDVDESMFSPALEVVSQAQTARPRIVKDYHALLDAKDYRRHRHRRARSLARADDDR
jgi:hypothetical protein